jgi:hypothetical protein
LRLQLDQITDGPIYERWDDIMYWVLGLAQSPSSCVAFRLKNWSIQINFSKYLVYLFKIYLWANSCEIVNAVEIPLSSFTLQLWEGKHILPP